MEMEVRGGKHCVPEASAGMRTRTFSLWMRLCCYCVLNVCSCCIGVGKLFFLPEYCASIRQMSNVALGGRFS